MKIELIIQLENDGLDMFWNVFCCKGNDGKLKFINPHQSP